MSWVRGVFSLISPEKITEKINTVFLFLHFPKDGYLPVVDMMEMESNYIDELVMLFSHQSQNEILG